MLLLSASLADAATVNWTGTTSGLWETVSNWSLGRLPNAADTVTFGAAPNQTITINNNQSVGNVEFLSSATGAYVFNSGRTLTLGSTVTFGGTGTVTFNNALALAAGGTMLTGTASSGLVTVNSVISGSGSLTFSGGNYLLTNVNSSYTGVTTITGGAVVTLQPPAGSKVDIGSNSNSLLGKATTAVIIDGGRLNLVATGTGVIGIGGTERTIAFGTNGGYVDFAGPINANNNEIWSFQTFAGTPASTPIVHYGRISSATDGWKKNGNALQVGDANAATVNGLIGSGPIIFDLADNTAQRGALLELSNTDQFTGTLTIRGVVGGDSAAANNAFNVSRVELARDANHAFDWVFENAVQVSTLAGLNLSQNIDGNITLLAGADVAFQGRPDNLPGTLTLGGANKANETLTIHAGAQANMDVGFRTDRTSPAGVHLDMKTLILDGGVLRFRQSVAGLTPRAGDNMQINGNVIGAGTSAGPDALFDVQIDVGTNPGQLSMGAAAGFVVNGSGFGGLRVEGTSTRLAALLTGTRIGGITGTGGVFTVAPSGAMIVGSAPAALNNPVRLGLASSGTGATITAGAVANDLANWAGLVVKGSSGTGTTTVNLGANQSLTSGPGVTTTLDVLAGTLNLGAFNLSVEGRATLWTGSITGTTGTLTAGSFELQSGSVSAILAGSGPLAKTTAGTVTITSANTVTGGSTLSAGTVIAGNDAAFGATAARTVTFNGGSVASNNDGRVLANNIVVNNVAGNQITGGNSVTLTGAATGAGTLAVNLSSIAKTVTINSTSANSFAPGGLNVASGTMLLGSSDRIGDATNVVLSGGRFATGGFSDTLGDLTLSANSTIDFGTSDNSSLRFSSANWTGGELTILNWTGNPYTGPNLDHLYVTGSVSQSFLDRVTFAGYAPGAIAFDRGGGLLEIQPVPEPGTLGGALALVALVLVRERRRIGGWAASFSQSIQPQKRAARTVLSITKR